MRETKRAKNSICYSCKYYFEQGDYIECLYANKNTVCKTVRKYMPTDRKHICKYYGVKNEH